MWFELYKGKIKYNIVYVGAKWLTLKLTLILIRRLACGGAGDVKKCYIGVAVDHRSS